MLTRVAKRCFSTSGALVTWGETTYGWGRPVNNKYYTPGLVQGFDNVTNIASGPYHLAFTTSTSHLFTVGHGQNGRLGNGSQLDAQIPVRVQLSGKFKQLACGQRHTLALTQSGQVFAWGYGGRPGLFGCSFFGARNPLGTGSQASSSKPVKVNIQNVTQISAGKDFSLALSNGKVYGWGQGLSSLYQQTSSSPIEFDQLNALLQAKNTQLKKMSSTDQFAMFLLQNGKLYAVGKNIGGATATRHNAKIITDNQLILLTKINDQPLNGQKIVDFQLSANSLILKTESGAIFYSGMHAKFMPTRFPVSVAAKSIFATKNSVGIVGQDSKIYFVNDPIVDDYDKKGDIMISDQPLLKGAYKIGGTHQLRFALKL